VIARRFLLTDAVGKKSANYQTWIACVVLPVLIAPFTLTAMRHTNNKLHNKAATALPDAVEDHDLDSLLRKWTILNAVRAVFPTAATVLALWALTA
jgi:hypothetical protein